MVPSILCLSVLLSLCVSSLAPPVQMSDSWSRKQMCWVIWAQHPGPLIPPVYPPTSCANRPQNQTAVSNLLQSVHPLPCFLLPPCRPLVCKSPKPGSCNAELLGRGEGTGRWGGLSAACVNDGGGKGGDDEADAQEQMLIIPGISGILGILVPPPERTRVRIGSILSTHLCTNQNSSVSTVINSS